MFIFNNDSHLLNSFNNGSHLLNSTILIMAFSVDDDELSCLELILTFINKSHSGLILLIGLSVKLASIQLFFQLNHNLSLAQGCILLSKIYENIFFFTLLIYLLFMLFTKIVDDTIR